MDRYSSRSASRSRSRSPRRKHKKHKHRHSNRSRSRRRSRSRTPPRIHLNPAFGMPPPVGPSGPQMGYSASQLLQNNNALEAEVAQLRNALRAEQANHQMQVQRNLSIGHEIRNMTIQRDNAQKRCSEVVSERRLMMEMKTEMANRVHGLEVEHRQLRERIASMDREMEAKNQELRGFQYQADLVQRQISALNERNEVLRGKCEKTVDANRQLHEELNAKQKFVDGAKLNVKKAETDVQLANIEIQRLLRELDAFKHSETVSHTAKRELDQVLQRKEDELKVARFKSQAALKLANEKIDNLERRLKSENPTTHDELTVERIYSVIETIKKTYESQLGRLEQEVEELRADRLKDHEHEQNPEQKVEDQQMEELPDYLLTPRKPKTIRNTEFQPEDVQERPSSAPPVDSPITWRLQRVPLFGTTTSTLKPAPEEIHVELSEEDLLLAGPSEESPILNADLDLVARQLLDEN